MDWGVKLEIWFWVIVWLSELPALFAEVLDLV
jgi:hypothetical protein